MKTFLCALLLPLIGFGQSYQQASASQIKLKIKKLNFLGSVLYVAAHPDDENTRIISHLANERLAAAAYLSMTRGDGGQNLIGPEIRDLLGLIRTQELLAARRIDGGQQFFTRANDFGFSKSAEETFRIWGKENILHDVVKVYRQFQPDIIITRFPPDERAGHGHHTASAILAQEAFDAAAKPDVFPDQVAALGTWQVKRLFTNTGRWWNREINENTPGVVSIDVGGYNSLLGKSITEISALSSSQHKSQGWGRRGERGYSPEFLEHAKGTERATKDIFEGVNTTWSRLPGGEKIKPVVDKLIADFNDEDPAASVPLLFQLRKEISKLPESVWKKRKLQETETLIQDCLGLFVEVTASHYFISPGAPVRHSMEVVSRSKTQVRLEKISVPKLKWDTVYNAELASNKATLIRSKATVDESAKYSDPYWLREPHSQGMFTVSDSEMIGLPENPPAVQYTFDFTVGPESMTITRPLIYKWVDPVKGELWRGVEVVPPVFVNLSEKVMIFSTQESKEVRVKVRSSQDGNTQGKLYPQIPAGWKVEPTVADFELKRREAEQSITFQLFPPAGESASKFSVVAEIASKKYGNALDLIQYDHFPIQTLLPVASAQIVRIELKTEGKVIGYVRGAGDEIPAALRNMGYEVWEMKDEEITPSNLKRVDAVVMGVRAVNTNTRIRYYMDYLLDYVNTGGTLVVQYNTNFDFETDKFSPYPLKLSRDRVTEEDAEVRILKPEHELLNTPNKITGKDFDGWAQERGLYFPNEWDPAYEALISMNDKGESPKNGGLLVARYGQGYYVYTGLSFFRELPEGVPGAYKLFANLVSIGKTKKPENPKARNKAK